ncbi:acetyl-CoA carboxylase biotin carboxyl carrier protein [Quadrisphaera sp. DSM 44207]|uniref:acetyl-CoA carboxylase biotin carboxyl carrier protein n=1 Tax=Quadrisphaera sp. DSM 44207 TaxID=1881057 RepID=UPI000881745E|nr:acetyl-CoA carboxylase biotin carboxyl carrier protein [Quadrisphaera sp. DSM 44207]SDQ09911.1 acetyl-CoA carboxylase biotin carboxyl carrier protein [Quadrisphaera sp. DSM 44207]
MSASPQPSRLPAARTADPQPDDLAELCEQAVSLARSLRGPLRRIAVRRGEAAVEVDWHEPAGPPAGTAPAGAPAAPGAASAPALVAEDAVAVDEDADGHVVRAPLVGTFYRSPSPGAEPFVSVGDVVAVGQALGIVEAMKLMNPILSDVEGEVVELLVGDAQAVEFEQPLVRVRPGPQVPGAATPAVGVG